ncbi:MAG TPA: hypothetical protein VKR61_07530 [Bryobacteraceae bacterium]|nr:hypothetical protein [Bryobacteraceae bacterium]
MFRKTLFTAIACGLMAFVMQPQSAMAAKSPLAGSWQITLTPTAPPTPPVAVYPGLATFTTDGSMIETDGTELAPSPASSTGAVAFGSPGHGIWQLLPCLCGFYIQYHSVSVNSNGSLSSTSVTVATVTVSAAAAPATFTGQYTTTTTGPSGISKTTTGAINGTLIPHPLLP